MLIGGFVGGGFTARELERKSYLKSLLSRTPQQIAEEDFLYVESRRLEQSYHKIVEERRELLKILGGRDGVGMNMNAAANGVNSLGGGGIKGQGVLQQQVSKKKMTGWEFEGNGNGLPEGWAGEGSKRKATAAQGKLSNLQPSFSPPHCTYSWKGRSLYPLLTNLILFLQMPQIVLNDIQHHPSLLLNPTCGHRSHSVPLVSHL